MPEYSSFIRSIRTRYLSGLLILALAVTGTIIVLNRAGSYRSEIDLLSSSAQDGKLPSSVNGQAANKAGRESRSGTDPVDGIDGARVVLDAPMSLNLSTPASAVLHATGDLHVSAQEDVHVSARQTHAVVAGVGGIEDLRALASAWKETRLPAALAGHVYGVDADLLYRPGPRLVDAAEALCKVLDQARPPASR